MDRTNTAWNAIRIGLRARWPVIAEQDDWCGLQLESDGEPQRILVQCARALPQLALTARVCAAHAISPGAALRYNAGAARGLLALERDSYLLRALVPLTVEGLDDAIAALAGEAARLRGPHVPVRDLVVVTSPFVHYAD